MIKEFELNNTYNSKPYFNTKLSINYNTYKNGSLSFINRVFFNNLEIVSNSIVLDNNYHCKKFLLGWRDHLRNLMPTKLVKLDNENLYNIYDVAEYIKNDRSKRLGIKESKYIYYIRGISELRVYINYDRTLIKIYDKCGESSINITNDNLLDSRESYYIKAMLYETYKKYIKVIDDILPSLIIY